MKNEKTEETSLDVLLTGIGDAYCTGFGMKKKDYDKAYSFYRKVADMGNVHALYMMAECLSEGKGTAKDTDKALETYEDAAAKGSIPALLKLGDIYWTGIWTVPGKNQEHASQLYIQALNYCEKTNDLRCLPYAYVRVARCLHNGVGMEKDDRSAYHLYAAAIDGFHIIIPMERNFDERELEEAEDGAEITSNSLHLSKEQKDVPQNILYS